MKKFLSLVMAAVMIGVTATRAEEYWFNSSGTCAKLCEVDGIKTINTSTGFSANLFAASQSSPTLVIELGNKRCYGDLAPDEGPGINIQRPDGSIYHTHVPEPCPEPVFFFTPTTDNKEYTFRISATGTFYVYWGDGTVETIKKTDTASTNYKHKYTDGKKANEHEIGLAGKATEYSTGETTAAISFYNYSIKSMRGCLGCIFSTITDESVAVDARQPRFFRTFGGAALTGEIPETLFSGVAGVPVEKMFNETFWGCRNLTSIPENLFGEFDGAAKEMFDSTFAGCTGLTSIPENLFAGIKGEPAQKMFYETFLNCTSLTSIPENLFGEFDGAALMMFGYTFSGCTGLTNIPENLFAGIKGAPAENMFNSTFSGCSNLSGEIPENLFAGIKGAPARGMFVSTFANCSNLTGEIPGNLFAGIKGAPAGDMFGGTFSGCSNLSGEIPENLFAGITGAPEYGMFSGTFKDCSNLSGEIPGNLFAGISGGRAVNMFSRTFSGCSGLTGIGTGLFDGIATNSSYVSDMFYETFRDCINLTGSSAKIGDKYLYEIWPPAPVFYQYTYKNASKLTDYESIPSGWK